MKKALLNCILGLSCIALIAQPSSETFPDFTFSDLDGNVHHLQSYLDEGKTVVIDVFATWCPPCQNSVPGIEELYATHGQAGDQSMVVLSFERDVTTDNEAEFIAEYGMESPVITEATELIANTWNITYQPRYFVICPDGTFLSELNQPIYSDPQPLVNMAENCETTTSLGEESLDEGFELLGSSFQTELRYTLHLAHVQYSILDLTGAEVDRGSLSNGQGVLELSSLPTGMYFLQLRNATGALTKRIIKTAG